METLLTENRITNNSRGNGRRERRICNKGRRCGTLGCPDVHPHHPNFKNILTTLKKRIGRKCKFGLFCRKSEHCVFIHPNENIRIKHQNPFNIVCPDLSSHLSASLASRRGQIQPSTRIDSPYDLISLSDSYSNSDFFSNESLDMLAII